MIKHPDLKEKTVIALINMKIADLNSHKSYLEREFKFVAEHMQEGLSKQELVVLLRTNIFKTHEELKELQARLFLIGG